MSLITASTSIYDALLVLATPQERDVITKAGPRQNLDHVLVFGTKKQSDDASAAYDAIRAIIERIGADKTLRINGIDSRMMPPKREIVDAEVVLTGRLMWEGDNGVQSKLQMEWMSPPISIANLRIEPVEQAPNAALVMAPSAQLAPGERKDDTKRLRLMQKGMDDGRPPKTAARNVALALPDPPTSEESLTTRLLRKYKRQRSSWSSLARRDQGHAGPSIRYRRRLRCGETAPLPLNTWVRWAAAEAASGAVPSF